MSKYSNKEKKLIEAFENALKKTMAFFYENNYPFRHERDAQATIIHYFIKEMKGKFTDETKNRIIFSIEGKYPYQKGRFDIGIFSQEYFDKHKDDWRKGSKDKIYYAEDFIIVCEIKMGDNYTKSDLKKLLNLKRKNKLLKAYFVLFGGENECITEAENHNHGKYSEIDLYYVWIPEDKKKQGNYKNYRLYRGCK